MTTEASTARHDQIVFAAARLFAVRGYHSTSMDDIAAAVGIRKPTLYHHVTSKAQILLWIHDELATILTSRLRTRIVEGRAPSVILYGVIDDIFDLLESRPGHLGVYFEHHRDIPEPDGAVARARREEYRATVESLIQHGIDLGDFAVESPKLATLAFFGMCNWAYQWYQPSGEMRRQEIAYEFWRIFMSGVSVRPLASLEELVVAAAVGPTSSGLGPIN